ncbi:MAG: hypothetical protein GXY83_28120 [Rhodopirellula sp.]|nr:hypothetical protein [Rhodopirellula sp.]
MTHVLRRSFSVVVFCSLFTAGPSLFSAESDSFVFETKHLKYVLGGDGTVRGFINKRDGRNYLKENQTHHFCSLQKMAAQSGDFVDHGVHAGFSSHGSGKEKTSFFSNRLEKKGDHYVVSFSGTKSRAEHPVKLTLDIRAQTHGIAMKVVSVAGDDFFSIEMARSLMATTEDGADPFAGTVMPLTIDVTALEFCGRSQRLGGVIYRELGYDNAALAVLGAPASILREEMKTIAARFRKGEMPVHAAGGPFAMDDPRSRGIYIITSTPIRREEVQDWCAHLSRFGVDQVYFHQGLPFRQGDFVFNKEYYPNGISDFREVSREFNKHGITTGILTYAHFVHQDSRFVTPVPHQDLDVMRSFTLDADLDEKATFVPVGESTADVSNVVGFSITNSVVLRIDDELIVFEEANDHAPYGFIRCRRGAYGTKAVSHEKGAAVGHVTQRFGLFCSRPGSDLVLEVSRETARAYNEGGFGMIYLDALDGTGALAKHREYVPYYDTFFINEILKHTQSVPVMDYCFVWYPMSRVGEWDCPRRGFRQYFDRHVDTLKKLSERYYLPGQFGWIALCPSASESISAFQCPPMHVEDTRYLATKALAHDYGLSFLDVSLGKTQPLAFKNGAIIADYIRLRREKYFSQPVLDQLKTPGAHFVLQRHDEDTNRWSFHEADYQYAVASFPTSDAITDLTTPIVVTNRFQAARPTIRIENRYSAEDYQTASSVELIRFDETQPVGNMTTRVFDPTIDLQDHLAMGLWVYGDNGGQKINVRVESPIQYVSGHNDHFIDVDFSGWRYFSLIEAENGTRPPIEWPKPCGSYLDEYREIVHYDHVSEINLMIVGDPKNLRFRTLKAVPLRKYDLIDPSFVLDDKTFLFKGTIGSGHYMEWESGEAASVCNHIGEEVSKMKLVGDVPALSKGENRLTFSCGRSVHTPVRARLVFGLIGDELEDR